MRANVRQGDSSHSVDWCDDPPHSARCPSQCSGGRCPPRQPCRQLPEVLHTSIPWTYFFFFPKFVSEASVPDDSFTCSKVSLKRSSCCHRPCVPSCFSFAASANTVLAHALLMVTYSHIPRRNCSHSKIFHDLPR